MTTPLPSGSDETQDTPNKAYVFPASFAQRRLWFLDQFEPNSAFYNIPIPVRLPGPLDPDALRESLNALVRRHESLRTTFGDVDGEPVQVIAPSLTLDLPLQDLREVPAGEREAEAQRLASIEAQTPFDLKRGPLLRAQLLRLDDADHVLLLNIHHIVFDGWSMGVFFRELNVCYNAYVSGQEPALPELPIQYADFACWQREWLKGPVLEEQLGYWRRQLEDAPAVLELPADRPRPPVQVFRGGVYSSALPPQLSEALKRLGEEEEVTLFMTLLAGFETLLHRYTGEGDIVVGTPIANRTRPELEGLIGFFTNTLVLRTRVSGEMSFRELLRRVREVTLGAYAHQEMPFERLVEELAPERDPGRNPLFQVMLVVQNVAQDAQGGGGELPGVVTGMAKFDLTVFVTDAPQGFQLAFEYNSDLFDPETVARMAGHFENILAAAAAGPDEPIRSLPMLSQAELLTLEEWNATQAPTSALCVQQLYEAQAARTPEAVAVTYGEQSLSYDELNARANFWAHRLLELGAGPDTCVGVCAERSVEMVVAVLAVLKAGAAYVPLDPSYPRERLAFMLEDARAPLLLTQRHLAATLPAVEARVLALDDRSEAGSRPDNPPRRTTQDNLAYVIYTSGSTGRPKGVAMPHRPLVNLLEWQMERSALPAGASTLQFASLSFDVSFQEIFSTLCAGGRLVLVGEEQRRDPNAVWQLLRAAGVSRLYLPYVALQQLAESARELEDLPASLREVITAGEQLRITPQISALFSRADCALYNQYGPSESHAITELKLSGPAREWPRLPAIGRPIRNVRIRLLDEQGQPVPVGVPGELYIGGDALARGYVRRPALSAERFVPDPDGSAPAGARLYRTGDRARYLRDGNIEFLGRFDHQLKIRGFRVEPGEVETALHGHAAVREAAVVARQDAYGVSRLVAYVQPDPGADVNAQELRAHLAASLPEHMLPSAFVFLDALPLTPSGKLDKRRLPETDEVRAAASAGFVEPRTPTEEALAKIWGELLGVERVGALDNFFEMGGHSLLATQVISRIRNAWRVELPLRSLFEAPTVERLALLILQAVASEEEASAERLLAEIERLSEGQAQALLRGE